MSPTADFEDRSARFGEEMIVDVVGVGVQVALVADEHLADAFAAVIVAEIEDVERVVAIADIDPHLTGASLAGNVRIEERHLGGVGVNRAGAQDHRPRGIDDGPNEIGEFAHPGAHRRTRQIDALPAEDAYEAIERQMIAVFAGGDLSQEAGARQSLVDRLGRLVGDRDPLMTLLAGVFETDVFLDEERGGAEVELLADLLAEGLLNAIAARAAALRFGKLVNDAFAAQVLGKRLATMSRPRRLVGRSGRLGWNRRS